MLISRCVQAQAECASIACLPLPLLIAVALAPSGFGQSLPSSVVAAEQIRVETVRKITPATIAIFDEKAESGGSGVIVSEEGYAVTNYHVVAPCGAFMKCGLPDGRLVDAVLVGVDPPGDVALIKLIDSDDAQSPQWPVAEWGDSDQVRVGDEAFVAGNPFLLADDFQPTITYGLISGVHRYQYPAGGLLEYADCLQTDAAINPGNSGGPLYNAAGQLIGVNGRASFEKRGRVNVGVGYAISANQVRRFLSHLASGRIVDHASLGATVRTVGGRRVVIDQIRETSDAYRRGLRYGDAILRFGDRDIFSANALKNALGTYPPGWRVPIVYQRGFETYTAIVRLERLNGTAELEQSVGQQLMPKGSGRERSGESEREADSLVASDWHEARAGFANYYFNRNARDRLLADCPQRRMGLRGTSDWQLSGIEVSGGPAALLLNEHQVQIESERGRYWAQVDGPLSDQLGPPGSGGLLVALHIWRDILLNESENSFASVAVYLGRLPWGPALELCECLEINRRGVIAELYFDSQTGDLIGVELAPDRSTEPCSLQFGEFHLGPNGNLPARMMVLRGDAPWLELEMTSYETLEAKRREEAK